MKLSNAATSSARRVLPPEQIESVRRQLLPRTRGPLAIAFATTVLGVLTVLAGAIADPQNTSADWKLGDGNRWPTPNEVGRVLNELVPSSFVVATLFALAITMVVLFAALRRLRRWTATGQVLGQGRQVRDPYYASLEPEPVTDLRASADGIIRVVFDSQLLVAVVMLLVGLTPSSAALPLSARPLLIATAIAPIGVRIAIARVLWSQRPGASTSATKTSAGVIA